VDTLAELQAGDVILNNYGQVKVKHEISISSEILQPTNGSALVANNFTVHPVSPYEANE